MDELKRTLSRLLEKAVHEIYVTGSSLKSSDVPALVNEAFNTAELKEHFHDEPSPDTDAALAVIKARFGRVIHRLAGDEVPLENETRDLDFMLKALQLRSHLMLDALELPAFVKKMMASHDADVREEREYFTKEQEGLRALCSEVQQQLQVAKYHLRDVENQLLQAARDDVEHHKQWHVDQLLQQLLGERYELERKRQGWVVGFRP